MTLRVFAAASILGLSSLNLAIQQPPADTNPPQQQPAQPPEDDREALRARLQRRLEEAREAQQQTETALKLLDQGEPTERVRDAAGLSRRPGGFGRPGMREGGPGRPGFDGPRTPLPRERVLEMLDEYHPEMAARLREAFEKNPEGAQRLFAQIEPALRELAHQRDPEMKRLRIAEMRTGWDLFSAGRALGASIRDEKPEEAEQARARLRTLLGEQFDLQVQIYEREIALLEQRLQELRKDTEDRTSARDEYVQRKLAQIEAMVKRFNSREHGDGRRGPPGPRRLSPGGPDQPPPQR